MTERRLGVAFCGQWRSNLAAKVRYHLSKRSAVSRTTEDPSKAVVKVCATYFALVFVLHRLKSVTGLPERVWINGPPLFDHV